MRTMKTTYATSTFRLISYAYGGSYPGRCERLIYTRGTPASVTRTNSVGENKTLTKGDRIHATPFTGVYRECVPISGELVSSYRNTNASGPDKAKCGDMAGTHASGIVLPAGFIADMRDPSDVPPDSALEKRLKDAADTKALASLTTGYYNLGIILAERRRSISYLTDKAMQLTKLIKTRQLDALSRYARTPRDRRKHVTKAIANEHLAFMFGLLPMIDEMKGIADLIAAEDTLVITGRGRQAKDSLDLSYQAVKTVSLSNHGPCAAGIERETKTRYSVRSGIIVDITIPALQRMREHGLNPIATFYDIVPLSFLSDFVSNTGTFLRAYEPLLGVQFRTAYSTLWRERKLTVKVTGTKYQLASSVSVQTVTTSGYGQGFARYLYVRRDPMSEMPTPTWLVQNNLSLAKAATLASLAIQRYLKPVRGLIAQRPFRYKGPRPKYLPPINYR